MNLSEIAWQLDILSRAVGHRNLSAAASQIGMSQPQLSRVVRALEKSLGVELLDRHSRRTSRWLSQAAEVAEGYRRASSGFAANIQGLRKENWPERVRLLTLEGLMPEALKLAHQILSDARVRRVELDVLDLGLLETQFNSGDCELILTSRAPTRRKLERELLVGYQTFVSTRSGSVQVLSSFEDSSRKKSQSTGQAFISNSLAARRLWVEEFGGTSQLPSPPRPAKRVSAGQLPVLLIGADHLPTAFWEKTASSVGRRPRA